MAGDHVLSIIERNLTFEPIINALETCLPLVMATKYCATCPATHCPMTMKSPACIRRVRKGEDEDHEADDATDGGRRAVTHIEHYNQHDRQVAIDDKDDDDDAAIEWG